MLENQTVSQQEIAGLVGSTVRDLMSKSYGSPKAKLAVSQQLLKIAEGFDADESHQREHERKTHESLDAFLRHGENPSRYTDEHRRLLGESRDMSLAPFLAAYPGSTGPSVLAPMSFCEQVTSAQKSYGSLLDMATVIDDDNGRPMPFPGDVDAESTGELLVENQQASTADVAGVTQTILGAYTFSSKLIRVSRALLNDQRIDLPAYLARQFAIRIERCAAPYFLNGTGVGQPTGVATNALVAGIAQGANQNDHTSGPNSISPSDLARTESALDPLYRPRASWLMHPNTLMRLRQLTDQVGHPLYPNLDSNRLFNYPVKTSPFCDEIQSQASSPVITNTPILLGDFSRFVIKRARPRIFRLDQLFAEFLQVAFLMLWRMDSAVVDPGNPIVALQTVY